MKRTLTLVIGVAIVATLFVLGTVPNKRLDLGIVPSVQAGEGCTLATLQGDYLFTGPAENVSGEPDPTYPRYQIGVYTFDGKGNLHSLRTQNHGGQDIREWVQAVATYEVDSECKGAVRFPQANWNMVITRDGKEGELIRTDAGFFGSRSFRKR